MRVAVYCRVSTDDQADAKTIENQVDFARKYCDLHSLEVHDFYLDEGVSGSVPVDNRPAGSRMIGDALRGFFGAVYVYRLDRLARTALDILKTHQRLCDARVILKSMTENFDTSTPSGKFFMTTLGGIAEIERETIAERMRAGKERALREGRWPGGPPPFGYRLESKRLVINDCESDIVRMIFGLYTEGEMSTVSIAHYLNAAGVPSPEEIRGGGLKGRGRWHGGRVWNILSNPCYYGIFLYGGRGRAGGIEVRCPPVISVNQWEAARVMRRKKALYSPRNCRWEYLLKGIIRCGICGRTYFGDGSGREGRLHYYRCAGNTSLRGNSEKCPSRSVRADLLEQIVWEDISRFILSCSQLTEDVPGSILPPSEEYVSGQLEELRSIEKMCRSKDKERKRIILLSRKGVITGEEAGEQMLHISCEAKALEKRKAEIFRQSQGPPVQPGDPEWLRNSLLSCTFQARRDLVRDLVERIIVDSPTDQGKLVPRVTVAYVFDGWPDCAMLVETRGKYRLGVPKSLY
ncbi:MAG: hypothetical protein VR68_07385 [Peptococcaceae bacterium BRH_c4a]|nr:MAG: hypothetical protein VR68_07385 [Peptococcaceae bacterium BRH_c4a]